MREAHFSEEQLARFQEGELSASESGHLERCAECKARLHELQTALDVYAEYQRSVRDPGLPPPPHAWRSLAALDAEHQERTSRRILSWRGMVTAAAVCMAVAAVVILRHPVRPEAPAAGELLARSAAVELPANRRIALRVHGRELIRPAVLTSVDSPERDGDLDRTRVLFDRARYSWRDPLNARSLQAWRSGLPHKRDRVSIVHPGGPGQAYRVQTETEDSILHSASLTLSGPNLRPTSGTFSFAGEAPLEMGETDAPPPAPPARPAVRMPPAADEIPAGPADTLHVLAALNAIGADAGEPITVSDDGRRVLVSAGGLPADRKRQVETALAGLPRVAINLDAAPALAPPGARPVTTGRTSTGMPAALRKQFEDRLGGAIAMQEATDRVLDASGSAVAATRALDTLAAKFPPAVAAALSPPDRELLRSLRRRHLSGIQGLAAHMRADLRPILPPVSVEPPPAPLSAVILQIDGALNRLLAGSYSEAEGGALLQTLAQQLQLLDRQAAESAQ